MNGKVSRYVTFFRNDVMPEKTLAPGVSDVKVFCNNNTLFKHLKEA